jgi:FKBP-type peptidyl-prolyl cis-trans isomerase
MKYKSWLLSVLAISILLAGCSQLDYKKTKSGLLYKIISTKDSKGPKAKPGDILKLYVTQKLNDSVLQTNFGQFPAYPKVQALKGDEYTPSEVFVMLHKGDSAVTVMLVDSLIMKGQMPTLPPFMKRGDRITVIFKIADVFKSDSLANADRQKEMVIEQGRQEKETAGEKVKEEKVISDYLASHKINAQRTTSGVYVEILNPGSGPQADSGKLVAMKYRGSTFDGVVFDTNMDSSFHHEGSYPFVVGNGKVIPGLDEGIRLLKKGGKAKMYIPAVLGYGDRPLAEGGKPYENLIFEIEVVDVKDKPETKNP